MSDLIDKNGLANAAGIHPKLLDLLFFLIRIPEFERAYAQLQAQEGLELIEEALEYLNIALDVHGSLDAIPERGPFITVSNHPFGFIDGLILLLLIGRKRPEYRATANFILSYIKPFKDYVICVNPFESGGPRRLRASEQVKQQLARGEGVGLFPAGEVSTYYPGNAGIQDKDWSLSAMKIINESNVPVIPIYFKGTNSRLFHWLGKIHPLLRTARIPAEFLDQEGQTLSLCFGDRLSPDQLPGDTAEQLATGLKQHVYDLESIIMAPQEMRLEPEQ